MSYILDALKRSEEKRGDMPASSIQQAAIPLRQSERSRWRMPVMLVAVALVVGWLVIQWQAWNTDHAMISTTGVQALADPEAKVANVYSDGEEPRQAVEHRRMVQSAHQVQSTNQVQSTEPKAVDRQTGKPIFKPVSQASPVSRMNVSPQFEPEVPNAIEARDSKSMFELPLAEQQSMPVIRIEGHIYDTEPSARMVIINGHVRKEKQLISAGLVLQEITQDGVILDYHGHVFHMGVFDNRAEQ